MLKRTTEMEEKIDRNNIFFKGYQKHIILKIIKNMYFWE